nr:uncharacterized protein LOC126056467 [Helicoverpa armigera]
MYVRQSSYVTSLQACPDPVNMFIQNYEGPVILHTSSCDNQQPRYHGNQYKQYGCDTECACVSKCAYQPPCVYSTVPANVVSGCCQPVEQQPVVYYVSSGCPSTGNCNSKCGKEYSGYDYYQSNYGRCY